MNHRILVVDDGPDLARGVAMILAPVSSNVQVVHSAEKALDSLHQEPATLVLSDVRMSGMDGLTLLDRLQQTWPRTRVILFTAYATIDAAVDAMKRGAYHYLTKPFDSEELLVVVRRALKDVEDQDEIVRLRAELRQRTCFHGIHTRDPAMQAVLDAIRRVAPASSTVLIWGESGTGKELVARAIHAESPRARAPLVAFNCAALPETLVEAELFGSVKGAYTSSDRDRKGLFLEAHGGTLFIDEVSSMAAALQAKLLRVLQEREVLPVGSTSPVPVNVRIVAATNVDPRTLLRDGVLRKDLYYRLSVVRIAIPPLRERIEDIGLLANLFLESSSGPGRRSKRLSARALRLLISHDWPGNVRELQNVIERAVLMAQDEEIAPADIVLEEDFDWSPAPAAGPGYEEAKRQAIEKFQRRYVEQVMDACAGNISAAARSAGMTRAALHRILKRLGLPASDPEWGRVSSSNRK